jgi:hypothetical protein
MNYSITDLDGFASAVRSGASIELDSNHNEDLDNFISISQVIELTKKHSSGVDEEDNLIINEETYNSIFDEVFEWIYGIAVARMASKGLIECAWDDEINEMVFWAAQNSIKE